MIRKTVYNKDKKGKFKLAFGIHNHQPVGNFPSVFEEAHKRAYAPFLKLLQEYDKVAISLHQSGILWQWQEENYPDYFELVRKLVDRGSLELMTGGFYEPILSSVPSHDAVGQIKMLTEYLTQKFNISPIGLWLTERIWEPHLPYLLGEAGVRYLPVDDTHFIYTGMQLEQLTGSFVTEHEGQTVRLLPIQKKLRYLIPFGTIDELINNLRRQAEKRPEGMAVYADDGEKFGVWPKTYEHCYDDGWLHRFFDAVCENSDWLEMVPLSRVAAIHPVGRVYLPTASYEEMLHWSLPPAAFMEYEKFEEYLKEHNVFERFGRFVRGGHWRGFLAKYDESNLMHKKMLRISKRIAAMESRSDINERSISVVKDKLYAAQCNCPYWHGVFGGLYLPHIRQAVYSNLVEADRLLCELDKERDPISIEMTDFDKDGYDELLVKSNECTALFKPNHGAMLLEFSANKHNFSLTDTLSRRREGYHMKLNQAVPVDQSDSSGSIHDQVLAKEDGLSDYLVEDWYLKRCFIDHFLKSNVKLADFSSGKDFEEGDFILESYKINDAQISQFSGCIQFQRDGSVFRDSEILPVRIIKEFFFEAGSEDIQINYLLSSQYPGGVDINFAIENNFNFQAGHADDRYLMIDQNRPKDSFLDATGAVKSACSIVLIDDYRSLAVGVASKQPAEIWHMPIFTVSLSESGFERVYQGTTTIHKYQLHLDVNPTQISIQLSYGLPARVRDRIFGQVATHS